MKKYIFFQYLSFVNVKKGLVIEIERYKKVIIIKNANKFCYDIYKSSMKSFLSFVNKSIFSSLLPLKNF